MSEPCRGVTGAVCEGVPIVYQDIVHFQICSFSSRLIFKLDECILQTVPSLPVSYDICSTNAAELGRTMGSDLWGMILHGMVRSAA